MSRAKSIYLALLAVALSPMAANAVPITIDDFDGSEEVIDFSDQPTSPDTIYSGSLTIGPVTLTPESGFYKIQPFGGNVIGASGPAFNTYSGPGEGDVTLTFSKGVSLFGMLFGNEPSEILSAVVTAFDSSGTLVESIEFPSFTASFVGFDFSTAVTSIVVDRTDDVNRVTFVDDIRYVLAPPALVPEPGTLALLGLGLAAMGFARRKKA